ncbi:preprotein translocase subunit SecE [Bythopirellula polymerisocia]|uniref:Protein translocase subunit SecE n=1 Tax=Bythopirellula polymerisocia TaxID=2528003 RepID=A0A5C6CZE8_9BACT|nr:preprotein translocase subunit SecE [Bythopirellula polymerisocia]TWU30012.1 preprotein translocase subunit SecE [Bythopirellula polymerisocia]
MAELISGMFNASRYKRSQGRIARQVTFAAIALAFAAAAWKLNSASIDNMGRYVIPLVVLAVGSWISFRIVNLPKFADFLISVEAEMNKVSWPGRSELWRASMVVIAVIFFLAGLLFMYDAILRTIAGLIF